MPLSTSFDDMTRGEDDMHKSARFDDMQTPVAGRLRLHCKQFTICPCRAVRLLFTLGILADWQTCSEIGSAPVDVNLLSV
uniref:Uncharacterized protein n=1 Tax=Trichuris muris TaxID=70415 RepID=A0A5S6PZD1_TRIMR